MTKLLSFALSTGLALTACSTFKVVPRDPETGYFPSTAQVTVLESRDCDLDSMKGLVLVSGRSFFRDMVRNMHYFDRVISVEDLENEIIRADLQSEVHGLRDRVGISNAYEHWGQFLWLHFKRELGPGGIGASGRHHKLIITDPKTMTDLLVVEVVSSGTETYDQIVWYPLLNGVVDYIRENSTTYN